MTCKYCNTPYGRHWSNAEQEEVYCSRACELLATTGTLPEGMRGSIAGKRALNRGDRPKPVVIPAQARTYKTGGS